MLDCIEKVFKVDLSIAQKKEIEQQDEQGHSDRLPFCKWLKLFLKVPLQEKEIWDLIRKNIADFVRLDKDATSILSELQKKYELVVLTNGGTENQKRKIVKTGLNHFFSFEKIFISQAIGYDKPNPKAFQKVAAHFDSNASFFMIGDHWENDVLGAQKFGWKAIYVNPTSQHSAMENVKIIPSLQSLNKALNEFE